ncbi:cell surface protein [Clostridioides difficile]|nr:cell surface protein [Clostridioides difficile]VIB33742.1 cell surface protein [Clostridioides difficile]VIB46496.1 cell surface protein [Clostridioides difficile]VII18094.1 cell surface protein [Clostridioides difficile]VII44428.1 cell surface protein [Clostridioides difficile]
MKKKLLSLGLAMSMFVAGFPISANALDKIDKIQGADKYEIAGIIADKQSYTTAILINADSTMADGLSASGLAGATNAPILLTKKNNIPNVTLKRVEKANKVYIIGGESSIDKATETFLKDKGIETKRLQGSDRIKTSYNVAKEINSINKVNKVILTNAFKGEPDAMSIASVAVRDKAPIVLTDGKSVPFNTTGIESYAIGGTSSMSDKLVNDTNSTRLGGVDRYDTNKKIVNKFYNGAKEFYIASGTDLVYALVGSTMAKNTPIVLVNLGSNKEILKDATKITTIGAIDSNTIQECLNITNALLRDILGVWYDKDSYVDSSFGITNNTIVGNSYDIISIDEKDKSVKINVHYPDGDLQHLIKLENKNKLWFYTYNEINGGFSGGTPFEKLYSFNNSDTIYKNSKYGFSLRIPQNWEGKYKVNESKEGVISFDYYKNGKCYDSVLYIETFDKNDYDEESFRLNGYTYLGTSKDKVFCCDLEGDPSEDALNDEAMLKEISKMIRYTVEYVINSFEIIK